VVFSEAVAVTGTPRLVLTIGSTTRYAEYDPSSSSSANLVFRYPVQSGDLDPDGIAFASTSIDLNNGAITDVPGNNAVLTFTPPDTSGVLVDGVAPTITSVTGPDAGTYIVGQTLDFTVVFSEAVAVTGTPRLVLTIGSTTRYAEYDPSSSSSANLVFRYPVQSGDLDPDGIAFASTSIDLNNGAITDVPGNNAVLTFTPPDTSGVLVDGVAPTITSVTGPDAGTYIVGQTLDFTVVFSEAVAVTGTPRLVLTIGSTTRYAEYDPSSSSSANLVFRYPVQSGDLDPDGIAFASTSIDLNNGAITDVPGNNAVLTFTPPDTSGVLVDGVAPTITSVTGPDAGTYIVGQTLDFTVVFSEAVAVTGTPRLVLTIGSTTRYAEYDPSSSSSANLVFRYPVQSGDLDPDGIAFASTSIDLNNGAITDVPGNNAVLTFTPPDTSGVLVDGVAPTITSVTGPDAGTYIVGQTLDFTVVFSEAVAVTGTPRLVLTIGSTTRYAEYDPSSSSSANLVFRYPVQSGDLDPDGIAFASTSIDLNNGAITDVPGNNAVLTFTPPDTSGVLVDGVAPTITSVTGPDAGTYIVGQTLDFTVVFSEAVAVTGTPRLVLTIGSTTRYAEYDPSSSSSANLVFRYPVQSGDLDPDGIAFASTSIDLNNGAITDVPGNNAVLTFTPPDTSGVLVDGVAPTITSVMGPDAGTYIVGQTLDFTVVFSEAVAVTGTPRLVLTIGSTTRYAEYDPSSSSSANLVFRYPVQSGDLDPDGIAFASTSIDLNNGAITDVPGNNAVLTFTPPDTSGVLVDGVAPTITSVMGPDAGTYIVGQTLDFTVVFSEAVAVTGTPRLVLTIGSTTRYAEYDPSSSSSANLVFRYPVQSGDLDPDGIAFASTSIDLNNGAITDVPGNNAVLTFTPPDTSGVLVDGVAPTITSVTGPDAGTYIVGQTLDFTVVFSEAVAVTGTPRLVLTIGSTTRYAEYDPSSSSSANLVFRYPVQSGDLDPDGIAFASTSIDLNNGAITDVPGNNAVLTFTPPDTSGVLVDGVAPTITSVTGPDAGTYIVGQTLDFTVVFSEAVAVTGTPRLVLTIGSTTRYAEYDPSSSSSANLVFRYPVQSGDLDPDGIAFASTSIDLNNGAITDVPGNNAVLTFTPPDTSGVLVDGVAPTITSVTGPDAGTYIVGQTLDFTVVFSEAVAVTGTPRLVLTIGSTTRYAEYDPSSSSSANLVFRYPVQSGDLDPDGIAFASTSIDLNNGAITDVPGNNAVLTFTPPDTSGVLVDGVAPTITSVTGPDAGTYIVGQTLDFTVVFSEAVAVTGTPRLVLTIGSTTRYAEYDPSSSSSANLVFRYPVQSGDLDPDGIAFASTSIDLNNGAITDVPGNNAVLTFTPPDTSGVLVDGVAPTITSVTGPDAGTYIVGQTLDFTVVFSEAVAVTGGTPRLVLTIGSTTRYAEYDPSSSSSANLVFRYPVQSGDLDPDGIAFASTSIDLNNGAITDVPGNNAVLTFTPPDTSGVLVDGVAPTITSVMGPDGHLHPQIDFTVVAKRWQLPARRGSDHRQHRICHVSGTGTSTLVFRYTVKPGDLDSGIAVASTSIDLKRTITDAVTTRC
jgi:hypothetical protein